MLLAYYFQLFDDVMLEGSAAWFGPEGREGLFRRVLEAVLGDRAPTTVAPWGERRQITMKNVFFQGKLPRWLGFDHGPVPVEGGRSTIAQSALFTHHGHAMAVLPSWRYATDLGQDEALTVLAGGVSGSRFSALYTNGVADWLAGRYKTLRARAAAG